MCSYEIDQQLIVSRCALDFELDCKHTCSNTILQVKKHTCNYQLIEKMIARWP